MGALEDPDECKSPAHTIVLENSENEIRWKDVWSYNFDALKETILVMLAWVKFSYYVESF